MYKHILCTVIILCASLSSSAVFAKDYSKWKDNPQLTSEVLFCLYEIESYLEKTVPQKQRMKVMESLPVDIVLSGMDVLTVIQTKKYNINSDVLRKGVSAKVDYAIKSGSHWMHMLDCGIKLSKAGLTN